MVIVLCFFNFSCGWKYQKPQLPALNSIPADMDAKVQREIQRLYSKDLIERAEAMYNLGSMGPMAEPAIPYLAGMLYDASSIDWPKDNPTVNQMYERFKGTPFFASTSGDIAAWALSQIGEPAVEALSKVFSVGVIAAYYPHAVRSAGKALAAIKGPGTDVLLERLGKGAMDLRKHAAESLGYFPQNNPQAVDPLIKALDDWSIVSMWAVGSLGEIGDPRAIQPILKYLDKANPSYDAFEIDAALKALGKLKAVEAVDTIIFYLMVKSAQWDVRPAAHEALVKITGRDLGYDWGTWASWWKQNKVNY